MPVCSIGAIPVARELSRAGLGGATVLAFAVSVPLFNPISLLYGLTLSHPLVIVGFALASMAVVTVVGLTWERLDGGDARMQPRADEQAVPPGWRRAVSLGLALVREAADPAAGYAAVALLGVGALAACLPFGSLQRSLKAFDPTAIPTMAALGLPAFLTPTDAMMQIGSMFDHGNSVGAAYVLLSVGAGLNLGLVAWAWRTWGLWSTLAWLGVLLVTVLVIAFAIERPLSFRDSPPEDHTHAFDVFCQPFAAGTTAPAARVAELLAERVPRHEWLALATLAIVVAAGGLVRWFDPADRIEEWLAAAGEVGPANGWSTARPAWDVAVAAGVTLRERIETLEHAVLEEETIDRDEVSAELKRVLEASRIHRAALRGDEPNDR